MFSKGKYVLLQAALVVLSPLTSMLVALRYYRQPLSWIFMVVFAYYWGMRMWLGADGTDHYIEFRLYFCGASFMEIYNNPMVFLHSPEPYAFLLKYLISRFTSSAAVFGGVLCAIYMMLQINFLSALHRFYKSGLSILSGLLLIATFTVVQFSWYQGVRFWPGAFWFMGFFLRYVLTRKWHHLALACLCPLMHYSLLVLPVAVVANYVLMKCGMKVQVLVFLFSLFVRSLHIDFLPYVLAHVPFLDSLVGGLGSSIVDRNLLVEYMAGVRLDDNVVYSTRSEVIALFLLVILFVFRLKRVKFGEHFTYFFSLAMTMASIANIEFADITFYDRFFKFAVLALALAVFIVAAENKALLNGRSLALVAISLVMITFEVVTHLVAMRIAYMQPELWFGNFFMDWHGGFDTKHMQNWGDLF